MNRDNIMRGIAVTCAVVLCVASTTLAGGAAIKGRVNWEGKPYRSRRIKSMNKECQSFHSEGLPRKQSVVTNENGTLRNVLVFIKNAPKGDYPPPKEAVLLDQIGCMYKPHVLALQVGQPLEIHNDDPTAHNIHFRPKRNREFNKSQPKKGLVERMTFKRAEVMVPVKCDVHPWMSAYIGVFDHPFFAVTGEDGTFSITGLPAGTYTVEARHEKYGSKTVEVTVAADETKQVEFTFARKKKK